MAIAGVFPGQGSQSVGMLSALSESFPLVTETFQEASDVLGMDLWKLVCDGPEEALNQTVNTQPAMLGAGVAVWRVWQAQGGCMPVAMAGHSLGEYSALVASGVLAYKDAVSLVRTRAELMQQAVPEGSGAMAAILGLDDEVIVDLCAKAAQGEVVQAVNFNSPGQVVIAGTAAAVDRAIELLSAAGAKRALKLSVSVPSHCDLMQDAARQLANRLETIAFNEGRIPVLHNVDAAVRTDAAGMKQALGEQLYRPVKWVDTVKQFKQDFAIDTLIEFGPGKVLFGLNRRIDKSIAPHGIHDPASLEQGLKLCEEQS